MDLFTMYRYITATDVLDAIVRMRKLPGISAWQKWLEISPATIIGSYDPQMASNQSLIVHYSGALTPYLFTVYGNMSEQDIAHELCAGQWGRKIAQMDMSSTAVAVPPPSPVMAPSALGTLFGVSPQTIQPFVSTPSGPQWWGTPTPKCECGSTKAGLLTHSDYCPLYKKR